MKQNLNHAAFKRRLASLKNASGALFMTDEIADRLVEHLDLMTIEPKQVLVQGSGCVADLLQQRYPDATIIRQALDEIITYESKVDIVVSHLGALWQQDISAYFQAIANVLKPNGLMLFSSFGPETFKEMSQAWQAVDSYHHVHAFVDMHHVGDALMKAGLVDPVLESEELAFSYETCCELFQDLKQEGLSYFQQGAYAGLMTPRRLDQFEQAYREQFALESGELKVSIECVFGHAWQSGAPRSKVNRQGEIEVSLDSLVSDT